MSPHQAASGQLDRNVNPADGIGSLKHGPRTHPAHADGRLVYNGADRDGQNGNPGSTELANIGTRLTVFAGIRNDITSRQGLEDLLGFGWKIYAVDTGVRTPTYHPKIFFAKGHLTGSSLARVLNRQIVDLWSSPKTPVAATVDGSLIPTE